MASAVFVKASPAVVQLVVSGPSRRGGTAPTGTGSGVVVDARGLVLTNQHVVDGARAVSVHFADGAVREGQVLGTDRGNDLALVKVELPPGASAAPLGDSDALRVGEPVVAIGAPFGLSQTVTQGIVSAVHRSWGGEAGRVQRNLIQTDAAVNPGNSGGPLLNAAGEVVGITSMGASPVRGSVGVNFAVAVNTARRLLPRLEAGANLEPVWLGIAGQELDPTIARDQGLAVQSGILITSVVAGSPAERAGLRGGQGTGERIPRGGDVIVAIDDQPVPSMSRLADLLAGRSPGDTIALTVQRGGQPRRLSLTLQPWPADGS